MRSYILFACVVFALFAATDSRPRRSLSKKIEEFASGACDTFALVLCEDATIFYHYECCFKLETGPECCFKLEQWVLPVSLGVGVLFILSVVICCSFGCIFNCRP